MVGHVLGDIAQEARSQDGDDTKCNTDIVHPLVGLRVRKLTSRDHHLVCGLVASNAGDQFDFVQQRGTREFDYLGDQFDIGNAELGHHRATDVVLRQWNKFGDEYVVVDAVADAAAYDTDGEREC